MFTCGRMPYPGVDAIDIPRLLDEGLRLDYPANAANNSEMYVKAFFFNEFFFNISIGPSVTSYVYICK